MNNIVKGSSIALIFIALSGCGSDDNDSEPTPTPTPTPTRTPERVAGSSLAGRGACISGCAIG
ncbi:endoglucanase, partial [Acinetobacter pittii]|nr:endoglucanase [Acinetobacter pittii]